MTTVTVPGCTLHYEIIDLTAPWVAEPQTILFHHGLGASSGMWAEWLPVLAGRFRIVQFDMRGHGRSTHPASDAPSSLDALVEDLFAVADAAGASRFHLVGESIGGTIALLAAIRRGRQLLSLTVSNGSHLGGSIQNIDNWRQIIDRGGMPGWSRHMMGQRFFDGAISREQWEWYERQQASAAPDFLLSAVRLLAGADLSHELAKIDLPVLLLHGDSSPFIPVSVMAELKVRLPDARLQVFAHARHGVPFSHARDCAQALRAFLDGLAT